MSKVFARIWIVTRFAACGVVALLNAIAIGFQGNGNLLLTGALIGLLLGTAWSVLLLFGLPALVRELPSVREVCSAGSTTDCCSGFVAEYLHASLGTWYKHPVG
jgi:hypothetical protein